MAEPEPVFDITKCDVTSIFPVPDEDWFVDNSVPQAPDDIADCPTAPIPLPPPEPPCPDIGVSEDGITWSIVPVGDAAVALTVVKNACCEFDFQIDVNFPCPQFPQGTVNGTTAVVPVGSETVVFRFLPSTDCGFNFEVDVNFPCPQFPVGRKSALVSVVPIGSEFAACYFLPPATDCGFGFQVEVAFPCPQFPSGEVLATTSVVPMGMQFAACYFLPPTTDCGFNFEIDIDFPCPDVVGTYEGRINRVPFGEGPSACWLAVTPKEDSDCGFNFEIDINYEASCPQLNDPTIEIAVVPAGEQDFVFEIAVDSETCSFNFNVDIKFPCPDASGVYPGTITKLPFGAGTHEAKLTVTGKEGSDCGFDFDLDIKYESSCPQYGLPVVNTSVVTANEQGFSVTITPGADCTFDLEFDVQFPCPDILGVYTGTITKVGAGAESATLTVVAKGGSDCGFDFELDINYESYCPQFNAPAISKSVVLAGLQDFEFSLTPLEGCTFDLDVDIKFPCPDASGVYTGTITKVGTGLQSATLTVTAKSGSDCGFDFDLDINYEAGCPQFFVTSSTSSLVPVSSRYLTMTLTPHEEECAFDIDFEVGFPCPTMFAAGSNPTYIVPVGYEAAYLAIIPAGDCSFEFAMEIYFPCPQITQGTNTINVTYEYIGCNSSPAAPQAYGGLVVTQVGDCGYELSLDMTIPIEIPDCGPLNTIWGILVFGQPTSGSFLLTTTLNYNTENITINYNAGTSAVLTALAGHSQLASTDMLIGGGPLPNTMITVTFVGAYEHSYVALPEGVDWGSLAGGFGMGVLVYLIQRGHP